MPGPFRPRRIDPFPHQAAAGFYIQRSQAVSGAADGGGIVEASVGGEPERGPVVLLRLFFNGPKESWGTLEILYISFTGCTPS